MKIDLKKYMNERDQLRSSSKVPGPIITISREYGCGGTALAKKFIEAISGGENNNSKKQPWSIINKEILTLSAQDLKVTPKRIEKSVETLEVNAVEELLTSLSPHYELTDKRIHQTVADVVTDLAKKGHVIIIGRGAAGMVKNIAQSLRIKLIAPLEWRIESVCKKRLVSEEEAKKRIAEMDPKRDQWNKLLNYGKFGNGLFDILFNRMLMTDDEIISAMKGLALKRGLI